MPNLILLTTPELHIKPHLKFCKQLTQKKLKNKNLKQLPM